MIQSACIKLFYLNLQKLVFVFHVICLLDKLTIGTCVLDDARGMEISFSSHLGINLFVRLYLHDCTNSLPILSFVRCGKTTQIPQFILDSHLKEGHGGECFVICTQPRRISAMSVAERVSAERIDKIGESVGYQVRLENKQVNMLIFLSLISLTLTLSSVTRVVNTCN